MGSRAFPKPSQAPLIMTITAEITEKPTKRGRIYIATLSNGVVVKRNSTKPKLYFAFFSCGNCYTLCSNSLDYIWKHGATEREDFMVVEIATNRIIPKQLAPNALKRQEREKKAAIKQDAIWERFQKAPKRLMNSMHKQMEFWHSHHPSYPFWAASAKWCEECTQNDLKQLFDQGLRTSGDLEDHLKLTHAHASYLKQNH